MSRVPRSPLAFAILRLLAQVPRATVSKIAEDLEATESGVYQALLILVDARCVVPAGRLEGTGKRPPQTWALDPVFRGGAA